MKNLNLIQIRKELHKIPEIAFQEFKTQDYLLSYLKKFSQLKIHCFEPTGILVEYNFSQGNYILFRADMDALKVKEETNIDFSSQNEDAMHACGHDIHMTILLGLIEKVCQNNLKANILFLFQPAEESVLGAKMILESKILDKYKLESVFAAHVSNDLAVGEISCKENIIFAIPQEFDVNAKGLASHAAYPEKGRDAILALADFCLQIKQAIKEKFPCKQENKTVLNIGKFLGGKIRNAVADYAFIQGTFRTTSQKNKKHILAIIKNLTEEISLKYDLDLSYSFGGTTNAVINDKNLYGKLLKNLPPEIICRKAEISLTGEDFGNFTDKYKGLLFWLGSGKSKYGLHNPKFLPDENCIFVGIDVFYSLIV